jgi:hypothetical protein
MSRFSCLAIFEMRWVFIDHSPSELCLGQERLWPPSVGAVLAVVFLALRMGRDKRTKDLESRSQMQFGHGFAHLRQLPYPAQGFLG